MVTFNPVMWITDYHQHRKYASEEQIPPIDAARRRRRGPADRVLEVNGDGFLTYVHRLAPGLVKHGGRITL